jgi:hypothetical protein
MPTELPSFGRGETLSASKLQALVEAIKELRLSVGATPIASPSPEPVVNLDIHRVFLAKITGAGVDGTLHTFQEQIRNGASIEDYTDGTKCDSATDDSAALEINGATNVAAGTYVYMLEIAGGSNAYKYQFSLGGSGGVPFKIVSTTATNRRYNAQRVTAPDTYSGTTDYIVINGAELTSNSTHPLLDAANIFGVEGTGVVVGTDGDTGLPLVLTHMVWTACEQPDVDGTTLEGDTVEGGFITVIGT